jgi:hypothetical protein
MGQGVAGRPLDDMRISNGLLERLLQNGFIHVVSPLLGGPWVLPPVLLWENPLPTLFRWSVGILPVQSTGHENPPPAFGQISLVNRVHLLKIPPQGLLHGFVQTV